MPLFTPQYWHDLTDTTSGERYRAPTARSADLEVARNPLRLASLLPPVVVVLLLPGEFSQFFEERSAIRPLVYALFRAVLPLPRLLLYLAQPPHLVGVAHVFPVVALRFHRGQKRGPL